MTRERLQKILSNAGLASRREAEIMILAGRVSINGKQILQLGTKADPERDEIRLDGNLIHTHPDKIYIMLNKPRGYVTTLRDPQHRPIVSDLITNVSARVYPVGRLDYDSQGLLFMSNDGNFAQKVLHPRFQVPKVYRVKIKGRLSLKQLRALTKEGFDLEDGKFRPEIIRLTKINSRSSWLSIMLKEGKNRIIRRAFKSINHDVQELIRVSIGGIELGGLRAGEYRYLTKAETGRLFLLSQGLPFQKSLD